MANPLDAFWKLLVDSRLLQAAECADLSAAFVRGKGADQVNPKVLCSWLMERGMLSRYQARLLLAGRTGPFFFGDYRVYDRVESGRLAGLFRAAHMQKGEPVLLYFFTGPATQDLRRWLPIEGRTPQAIAVKHPNVSRVDALVQADGYKFIVLEGLDGQTLQELSGGKPLPLADVCRYLRKAVAGLARLHNINQVHGDIRPDNLFLEHSGQLKLLYFPLSRDPLGPPSALDPKNADFLAPECGPPSAQSPDALSDIYSLGCTAYYLLSGQVPFPGGDAADKARRHVGETCVPLDQLAGVPAPLAGLVALMMSKDRTVRPASAMQLADELLPLLSTLDGNGQAGQAAGEGPAAKQTRPANGAAAKAASGAARGSNGASGGAKSAPAATSPKAASRTAPAGSPKSAPAAKTAGGAPPKSPAGKPAAGPHTAPAPMAAPPPPPGPSPAWPGGDGPPGAFSSPPMPGGINPAAPPAPPAAPLVGGAPPMPPGMAAPGFAPQPVFAPPGAPLLGVPVAAAPPMGAAMMAPQPAPVPVMAAPVMGMPAFAPPGFAAPVAAAYAAPVETMPEPAPAPAPAFDSAVMNVLDEAVAAPASSKKGPAKPTAGRPAASRPTAGRPTSRRNNSKQGLSPQTLGLGIGAVGIAFVVMLVIVMTRPKAPPDGADLAANNTTESTDAADTGTTKTAKTDKNSRKDDKADDGSGSEESASGDKEGDKEPEKPRSKPKPPSEPASETVEDDGKSLWSEPTSGPPIDVQYLPPGTQVLLAVRPAEMLRGPEGQKVLDALGPGGTWAKAELEKITGVPLAEMEQLLVAFSSLEKGPPQAGIVVRLTQPRPKQQMMEALGNPAAATDGKDYCVGGGWAYHWPAAGQDKVLAICGSKEMAEVVDMDGAPPMRKEMEKLLKQTDAKRQFTLLFAPKYLQDDGKPLMDGELSRLRDPLSAFLGDSVQAAAVSLNWGQDFFAELRLYSTDAGPEELARMVRDQLGKIPDQIETYISSMNTSPYSRLVLNRFPQMLRVLDEYTRAGSDENQAILRCYLPLPAGHNLVMGTELALFERGGAGGSVAKVAKASGPAEALNQKITLSFGRDTLEKTMEMISREIDTEIVIIGGDLQLEGITKNQSFGLDEKDKPAGEILRTVMKKANPDGKLVYVFKPKNPGEKDIIFITTRAAVEKRGDKLPPELAPAGGDAAKPKGKK